jgi:O-antigen/teichoic acid export membrane protein
VFAAGWRFAAKAYLVTLVGVLLLRANVFILEWISGPAALGQFSVASQIGEALGAFPASVALLLFPRLIRDAEQRWTTSIRTMMVVGLILALACAIVAVLAEPFVHLAFGDHFAPSVEPLRLLLPGVVALGMLAVVSQHLAAVGLPVELLGAWAGAFVLVAALGLAFVPTAGASGAALALSVGYCTLLVVALVIALRHRSA